MIYPQALWTPFHKACEAKAFGYKEDNNYLGHFKKSDNEEKRRKTIRRRSPPLLERPGMGSGSKNTLPQDLQSKKVWLFERKKLTLQPKTNDIDKMKGKDNNKVFGAIAIMGIAAAFLLACGERAKVDSRPAEEDNADEASRRTEIVDRENSSDQDSTGEKEWSEDEYDSLPGDKSLNDIRFADFQEKDWVDNEYIRTLRRYLDDFIRGNIEDEVLEPYRKDLQGQFVVYSSQPFLGGGLFLQIVFIDKPENIFCVNVYSDVDMQRKVVTGYRVQHIELAKEKNESTKEEMLQIMKEHPELKMW